MRSIWKGHIRFSLVTIPIQVFSAIESKNNISFKQIHQKDHGRIAYQKVCKECDEIVAYSDIVKGFEYESDQYVIFDKEELDKVKLKSTRVIDIEAFVDIDEVHPSRYESVYFVGPQGEVAQKTFALFSQSLETAGKVGIGRLILRDREDVVLLSPYKSALIMYKLRYPYELRDIEDIPDLSDHIEVDKAQLKLAKTLIDSLAMPFEKVDFEDRYRDALMELVEQKIAGKEIISISDDEDVQPAVDIMSALKASIEAAKKSKKAG